MRSPITNRDPGDEQPEPLFADPPRCTATGCQAGDRRNLCKHDADQAHGHEYKPRPTACIATLQLAAHEPIPF